jgi:TonB family protein
MRGSTGAGDGGKIRGRRSGNPHRDRWNEYVLLSTLIAAAFHAALFAFWPAWQVNELETTQARSEMIQIEPLILAGSNFEAAETIVPLIEDAPPVEAAPEPAQESAAAETRDLDRLDLLPPPSLTRDIVPAPAMAMTGTPHLVLETMVALRPDLAEPPPGVVLPMIRNPSVLTRFLRSAYNPIRPAVEGFVSVAMWVDERGSVGWIQIRDSSGSTELDEIALTAFNEVVSFTPARSEGHPIAVTMVISVPFNAPW